MNLTPSQKRREERRSFVSAAYFDNNGSVNELVKVLAKKFKVTEVTIYADIERAKAFKKAQDEYSKAFDVLSNL